MLKCFTERMIDIPTNAEAYVFPTARVLSGRANPTSTFPPIMKMVADAVSHYFSMPEPCEKQKKEKDSMATLLHRIVYVYESGIPIYFCCSHPSEFFVSSYALVSR